MNVVSLFSGIGGLDEGLRRAGMQHLLLCEADEYRRAVLAARFPGCRTYSDVRLVARRSELAAGRIQRGRADLGDAGSADLVAGGFPCQDLSVAGRRAGLLNGQRSSLFFEFARVADVVLPPGGWLLLENVPGLLSSNGGRDFAVLLATLAELGFHDLAWRVLDSRHFGVPQRRRRVFILARRARGRSACEVLLEPEGGGGDPQTRREARTGAAGTSEVSTLASSGKSGGWRLGADEAAGGQLVTAATLKGQRGKGGGGIGPEETLVAPTLVRRYGKGTDSDATDALIAASLTSGSHPNSNAPGRRKEDDVNLVLQQGVRRLTPVECERLQGFPDGWTDLGGTPDSRRYAALGDAVTVPVAHWIGGQLIQHLHHRGAA